MRRAVIATVGTVVGLAALLGYKSSGTVQLGKVSVGTVGTGSVPPASRTTTSGPTTLGPTISGPASAGPATSGPTTSTTAASGSAEHTYVGQQVSYLYGNIEVEATVKGSHVVKVAVPENGAVDAHSEMINSEAVPILIQEAEQAQGLNFDVVSGATFTSNAFAQSLASALSQAKL